MYNVDVLRRKPYGLHITDALRRTKMKEVNNAVKISDEARGH